MYIGAFLGRRPLRGIKSYMGDVFSGDCCLTSITVLRAELEVEDGLLSLSKPQHGPTDMSLMCSLLLVLLRWRLGDITAVEQLDAQFSESSLRAAFVFQGMLLALMEAAGRSISQSMERVRYLRTRCC